MNFEKKSNHEPLSGAFFMPWYTSGQERFQLCQAIPAVGERSSHPITQVRSPTFDVGIVWSEQAATRLISSTGRFAST